MDIHVDKNVDSAVSQWSQTTHIFFMGAVVGFFVGVFSVFFLEYWNNLKFEK